MPRTTVIPPWRDRGANDSRAFRDDGGSSPLSPDGVGDRLGGLTDAERHVLECLGAAVVLHWNAMSTDMQRTIFRLASPDVPAEGVGELSNAIARFLHDHKDRPNDR